jgi:predicted exporter
VSFDGNIRSIGMIPEDVLEDEIQIKDTWGAVREQALVFCAAASPEKALQKNDVLFQELKHEMPEVEFLSLASLIPSRQAQEQNLKRWSDFWNDSDRKDEFRTNLEQQGLRYGFTSKAFESFLLWLGQPRSYFTLVDFEKECNDKLVSPFAAELKDGQFAILTFVPDDDAVITFLQKMEQDIKIVSNRQFSIQLNHATVSDFTQFFSWAIIIIFVLLFILFRNGKKLILAFLPVLAGVLIMSAIMSVSDIKVNLFNMVAAVLVIGLAADYGIFIVCTCSKAPHIATLNAVLVSGLTTFVGFGSLIIARHPSMNSIGITVAAGIVPSLLCALTLLPYLTVSFLAAKQK